jgi:transcriptional regulator with XRE-family HTH domain
MKQRSAGKPDIEMGKKIRLRRVEQRISQSDLGEKLGVSRFKNMRRASIASAPPACSRSPRHSMCP